MTKNEFNISHEIYPPNTLTVKFKKLHKDATLPTYSDDGSAGLDCTAVSDAYINDTYIGYKLGFAVEIPTGYVGLLFPRSSISKMDLALSNSVGVIDSTYRGEVEARFFSKDSRNNVSGYPRIDKSYAKGDKLCQLIIIPIPKVQSLWSDELSETKRGDGGFGSTGK